MAFDPVLFCAPLAHTTTTNTLHHPTVLYEVLITLAGPFGNRSQAAARVWQSGRGHQTKKLLVQARSPPKESAPVMDWLGVGLMLILSAIADDDTVPQEHSKAVYTEAPA